MAEICILATYILYETGAHRVFSICIGRQMKQKMGVNKEFSRLAGCASCAVGIASDYQNWYIAIVRNNTEKTSYHTRVRDKKRLEKVGNLVKNSYLYR